MKYALFFCLLSVPVLAPAQTTREHRIPLEVMPHASGTDHLCLKERKCCDSVKRRLVRIEKASVAAQKAVCGYKPTGGAISILELCTLIRTVQLAALADTTTP